MAKHDSVNGKLDAIKQMLDRVLVDLKLARGGDRSYSRLTILRETLHNASMATYDLIEDLDLYGIKAAAKRARELRPRLTTTIVTAAPKRKELPAPGESIFD